VVTITTNVVIVLIITTISVLLSLYCCCRRLERMRWSWICLVLMAWVKEEWA